MFNETLETSSSLVKVNPTFEVKMYKLNDHEFHTFI